MTNRSVRRAAERKAAKAARKATLSHSNKSMHAASAPMPVPYEPEPVPILPSREIELPDTEPQPDAPLPSTSQSRADASRRNAAKHNGTSQRLIIDGERLEQFQALRDNMILQYSPASELEYSLVEDLAHARWFLSRRQRALNAIESAAHSAHPDQSTWSDDEFKRCSLADRYLTQAERAFQRALRNVDSFAKDRVNEYRWEANYDLATRRLDFQQLQLDLAVEAAVARAQRLDSSSAKNALSSPLPSETVAAA